MRPCLKHLKSLELLAFAVLGGPPVYYLVSEELERRACRVIVRRALAATWRHSRPEGWRPARLACVA
jgi:hypothetical protein